MADRDENELMAPPNMNRCGVRWSVSGGVPRSLGLVGEAFAALVTPQEPAPDASGCAVFLARI